MLLSVGEQLADGGEVVPVEVEEKDSACLDSSEESSEEVWIEKS